MITNLLEDKPLPIYGDGRQERDWLHVEDDCQGILAVLKLGRVGEIYNIGGSNVVENFKMTRRLLCLMDRPDSLLRFVTDRPGHDRRYALDSSKIKAELGWHPVISLDEGLQQTVDWYRTNAEWVAAVRGGEYRRYYEKYYENRDSSLSAITSAGEISAP